MAATQTKPQLLLQVLNVLKKKLPAATEPEKRPVMEELVYAICREGVSSAEADAAFAKLKTSFFDWNEVRVSTLPELEEALGDLPHPSQRAERIISVLQEWFELTFNFDMEEVAETAKKKGLKEGAKKLAWLKKGINDFTLAWVIQHGLGGHAIPLDASILRVLKRLAVIDDESEEIETIRGSIEHYVPKARGLLLVELLSQHAFETCLEDEPKCSSCPLIQDCPFGQERKRAGAPDPKPRKSR